ncbi:MAG: hypothetical protein MJE66_08465 [Proteobacteria bacterium]|nr:hypothetical protein [Pseudomonadota bacterium]
MAPRARREAADGLDWTSTRALFAELVAGAMGVKQPRPTPIAVTYLIELLEERVRVPEDPSATPETLAEALLAARQAEGRRRMGLLRQLGDRALFTAGFFGDSLSRKVVDLDYYSDIGRVAYVDLSESLSQRRLDAKPIWGRLFRELAYGFEGFVDILAEIADRARQDDTADLLRLYERYLYTGSDRDRERLLRRGLVPPDRCRHRRLQ